MPKLIGKMFGLKFLIPSFKPFEGEEGDKGGKKEGEEGDKGAKTFKTVEEAQQYVQQLEKKNKDLLKETMDRKEKIRAFEKQQQDAQEALQREQGKFKELYDASQPKVKRLEEVEPVLQEIFDLEIADVPEDKRDLIPDGPIEQKLKWVKNAKAKGLFGQKKEEKKPPVNSDGTKPNSHGATPDFVSWGANDPRLLKLSPQDYNVWKQHNRAPKQGVKGWGGA